MELDRRDRDGAKAIASSAKSGLNLVESAWVTEVLRFWFIELSEADWFGRSEQIDNKVRARFLALHEWLGQHLAENPNTARPILAAVIVFDQFSRHLFRGAAGAFASDALARVLSKHAIERGFDSTLNRSERLFLYLPLQHSEDREDQKLAVTLITLLGNEKWTRDAIAHKDIIDQFGRFPHRNSILGRPSSPEELKLLRSPESWF